MRRGRTNLVCVGGAAALMMDTPGTDVSRGGAAMLE